MNLFIDTNIYLSFYHFTSDDLNELNKLAVIMAKKRVTLYVPDQVVDEFQRNRESKIAQSLKKLKEQKLKLQFPQLCKDYDEYNTLRELQKTFEQVHADLINKVTVDISAESLKADKTIGILFGNALIISNSAKLIQNARFRNETNRPPGKKGSLGDALNWEALLLAVPNNDDLYFVSADGHYCSPISDGPFCKYLEKEWKKIKSSDLHFYKQLSLFFKENFPDIELSGELEKEILIRRLAASSSFSETHLVIGKLSKYSGFTVDQLNAILEAYVSNNQIWWIISDPDVRKFIDRIIIGNQEVLNSANLNIFVMLMEQESAPPDVLDYDIEPPF